MEQGVVPPTINLENPDLEAGCDLDYVPNVAYHYPTAADIPKAILSDNLGFGEWH
jgi:3-oxoacyl-[acyl-carrier-protein] synthase II